MAISANASVIPLTLSHGWAAPAAESWSSQTSWSAPIAHHWAPAPVAHWAAPAAHWAAPVQHWAAPAAHWAAPAEHWSEPAHVVAHAHAAPVAQYVAANRGSVHTAPLPGHVASATSLNLQPAPGTW